METLDETKVNMINVLFNIIFDSFLNFVCLIASLEWMPSVFMIYQKASFLILVAGSLLEKMDWTGSKAVAITASKTCLLLQMVNGGRKKVFPPKSHWKLSRWMYHLSEVLFCWVCFLKEGGYWLHGVFNPL